MVGLRISCGVIRTTLLLQKWMRQNHQPLVTSDYVLDELFTLLKLRESHRLAVAAIAALLDQSVIRVEKVARQTSARRVKCLSSLVIKSGASPIAPARSLWNVSAPRMHSRSIDTSKNLARCSGCRNVPVFDYRP